MLLGFVSLAGFWNQISALAALAFGDDRYTYIALVPLIAVGLIWSDRRKILADFSYCPFVGVPVLLAGAALSITAGRGLSGNPDLSLSIAAFSMILVWVALIVLCYGLQPLKRSAFPLLFLLLMVPIPESLMRSLTIGLQRASTDMAAGLFLMIKMPFVRDGFLFALPGDIHIEVAEQCSGIRSTLALLLSGLLAAKLFLGSSWRRACFALLIVPVVVFKNAVRITTISWLGVYVDRGYFFGALHHYGGIPFSAIAMAILGLALMLLRKSEGHLNQPA